MASDLNICSKRGLSERFDSTIGAGTVLMPFGGFIFIAFFAAALKALINKRFPEQSAETEMKIKKTSVIVSKKNLPEKVAPAKAEETPDAEESVESEERTEPEETAETVEVIETVEAAEEEPDDLSHFEPLDGDNSFDLADIFADDENDGKDYGSAFNRLFDEAEDFNSDEKKEGDK